MFVAVAVVVRDYVVVHMTLIPSDKTTQSNESIFCINGTALVNVSEYSITKCTPLSFALQKIFSELLAVAAVDLSIWIYFLFEFFMIISFNEISIQTFTRLHPDEMLSL